MPQLVMPPEERLIEDIKRLNHSDWKKVRNYVTLENLTKIFSRPAEKIDGFSACLPCFTMDDMSKMARKPGGCSHDFDLVLKHRYELS